MSLYERRRDSLLNLLTATRDNQRLGHSYVISGDSREDLEEFSGHFLKLLLCKAPHGEAYCGLCEACGNVDRGTLKELSSLEPSSKSRIIRADDMRNFLEPFSFKTAVGSWKIGVIHDADRMQEVAQNIFLKTLEEPPPRTIFILLSTKVDRLLPTTLSRCRRLSLSVNQTSYKELDLTVIQKLGELLRPGKGAGAGIEASLLIEDFLAGIRAVADEESKAYKDEIVDRYTDSSADNKKLKELVGNFVESSYRRKREALLSALEAYYNQLSLMAAGADRNFLAHLDFYRHLESEVHEWSDSLACCSLVERLKKDLEGNVRESLAFDNFCFQITKKR